MNILPLSNVSILNEYSIDDLSKSVKIFVESTFNVGKNVGGSFVIKGYMCDQIKQQEKV